MFFSRWFNGRLRIFSQTLNHPKAPKVLGKTDGHDFGLKVSPNGKRLTWSRFSPDFRSSQVLTDDLSIKNPRFLTLSSGIQWSPTWHPNGKSIIYSARRNNMTDYNLFERTIKGDCERKLTDSPGDEFYPSLSPDGQTLLFTSTFSGQEQIHKMNYPGPLKCK